MCEFKLRRGVTVRGRLVDPSGQPVREALLVCRWYLSRNGMTVNHAPTWKTLRGGRFELHGCDPGSSAPVLFLDAKKQRGAAIELSGKQAGEDVEVTMKPCGSAARPDGGRRRASPFAPALAGAPGGRAYAWAIVRGHYSRTTRRPARSWPTRSMSPTSTATATATMKTDANGRMTFPTLIPGATYRVIVFNQPVKDADRVHRQAGRNEGPRRLEDP